MTSEEALMTKEARNPNDETQSMMLSAFVIALAR
jgi:hypothetical protein